MAAKTIGKQGKRSKYVVWYPRNFANEFSIWSYDPKDPADIVLINRLYSMGDMDSEAIPLTRKEVDALIRRWRKPEFGERFFGSLTIESIQAMFAEEG